MEGRLYGRIGIVLVVILAAVYFLVPTIVYFSLPADQRNDKETFEAALPSWAPKKRMTLGLDLQGGVHLVMGVDVEKAVRDRIERRADEMRSWADQQGLAYASIQVDPSRDSVRTSFANEQDAAAFRTAAESYWGDMRRLAGDRWAFDPVFLEQFRESAVDQALRTIRDRIDKWGVTEPTIAKRGSDGILVQLPGFTDPERAKELLGKTAQLEFRLTAEAEANEAIAKITSLPEGVTRGHDGYQAYLQSTDRQLLEKTLEGKAPEGTKFFVGRIEQRDATGLVGPTIYRSYLLRSKVELTGDKLTDARVAMEQGGLGSGRPYVAISFDKEGTRLFGELTGANVGKRLAIVLDETVSSAPTINSKIPDGNAQITLGTQNYNQALQEANDLVLVLRSGALPAPVSIFEERTVGASLGPELVRSGTTAAVLGLVLVMLFIGIYYKRQGLIANLALVLNGLLILAALSTVGATLTLPGIAGFVLTLGMAVDANVLISERIREEIRAGRTAKAAIREGYSKAFSAIFDANVTTLVAAFVLLQYGTGPVRGFAVTLSIGIIASFFTAIYVTRLVNEFLLSRGSQQAVSV
jgi:preprotein translocase subunit SecD